MYIWRTSRRCSNDNAGQHLINPFTHILWHQHGRFCICLRCSDALTPFSCQCHTCCGVSASGELLNCVCSTSRWRAAQLHLTRKDDTRAGCCWAADYFHHWFVLVWFNQADLERSMSLHWQKSVRNVNGCVPNPQMTADTDPRKPNIWSSLSLEGQRNQQISTFKFQSENLYCFL